MWQKWLKIWTGEKEGGEYIGREKRKWERLVEMNKNR